MYVCKCLRCFCRLMMIFFNHPARPLTSHLRKIMPYCILQLALVLCSIKFLEGESFLLCTVVHFHDITSADDKSGQRQSWKTPGELGVSKSMECDIFSLQCFGTVG